ncbi:MAG: OpgC domain-containing protein [Acetobacteraceae bacterium]|nr:OpgC domain-containing protein [Acetobacteraceae bacterium]
MQRLIRQNRDLRVDFFRGYALFCIFIGHIPEHVLWVITIQVLGPSDATETFIFLAGYSAAFAYGRALERQGYAYAAVGVLLRVWQLYVTHIFMFLAFVGQVSWSAARFANPAYVDEQNIGAFLDTPYEAVIAALTLRFQPAFMDILPLYIVVLLLLVPLLPLLRRPLWLLVPSAALYLLVRLTGLTLTTTTGTWFFNPLAWQFLFMLGAAVSRLSEQGRARLRRLRLVLLPLAGLGAAIGLAISAVWRIPAVFALLPEPVALAIYTRIDKSGLHPARLLHFLSVAYLVSQVVRPGAAWLTRLPASPFTLIGQNGLLVFCMGIFLSFVGRLIMQEYDASLPTQIAIALGGLALFLGFSALQAWYDGQGAARPAAASPALAKAASPDRQSA